MGDADSDQWLTVYHHGINLMTSLLTTLKYNFLQDALNFVGVHQERMAQVKYVLPRIIYRNKYLTYLLVSEFAVAMIDI